MKTKKIEHSIDSFLQWYNEYGNYSFDTLDLWTSKFGISLKEYWLKHKVIGAPAVSLIHLSDIFFPSMQKIISNKKRYAIADAHLAMGFIGLYNFNSNADYYNNFIYLYSLTQFL